MATLGRGALILALLLGIYALIAAVLGGRSRDRRLILSSRRAVYAMIGAVLAADAVFMAATIGHDFSFVTVAETTSRDLPTAYLVTSFWALAARLAAAVADRAGLLHRRRAGVEPAVEPRADAVGDCDPGRLERLLRGDAGVLGQPLRDAARAGRRPRPQPVAAEPVHGRPPAGPVPRLRRARDPVRVLHGGAPGAPKDARWIVSTRRWTLAAWAFLGVGMLLGAHWAYVEVGWGGYWAWDPVENAALMPWLTATAFLHSVHGAGEEGHAEGRGTWCS